MAQPNGLNPFFAGNVQANSFSTPIGSSGTFGGWSFTKTIATSGGVKVNVFGDTIGFNGTLLGARIISGNNANGTVDIFGGNGAGSQGTYMRIAKGSMGVVTGCYLRAAGTHGSAFVYNGSLLISNNANDADCLVELIFVSRDISG